MRTEITREIKLPIVRSIHLISVPNTVGENGLYARADLVGYGDMYFDKANEYKRDAYQIVNAKIGYETEHYDIYLYGKNIFDEEYDYVNTTYTTYSDPGEVGLQVTYRF